MRPGRWRASRAGGISAVDDEGKRAGSIDVHPESGAAGKDAPYTIVGDDVVVTTRNPSRVIRGNPATSKIVWSTELPSSSLYPAVLVGAARVAAAPGPYGDDRIVSLVDVADGRLVHTDNAAGKISALCAVNGGDAVVAWSYTQKQVGWRNVASAAPERFTLQAPAKMFDLASHAPGVVVGHTGDALVFWTL